MKTYTDLSEALKEPNKVQILDLSNQELTQIPSKIGQLPRLIEFRLYNNQIKVIPPEIVQLTN